MAKGVAELVKALEDEGLEPGRRRAEQLTQAAEAEARQILEQANQRAEQIIRDAEEQSRQTQVRARSELTLAARDAVLRLRETIISGMQELLRLEVEQALEDASFLKELIQDLVRQYAQADADGKVQIELNLTRPASRQLNDWAISTIQHQMHSGSTTLLHDTLQKAGFEYRIDEGTVEVTVDSVSEVLGRMVGAELRERLTAALAGEASPAEDAGADRQMALARE
jgi:vacuolar-type H+-ATPase subunit E/Vma4